MNTQKNDAHPETSELMQKLAFRLDTLRQQRAEIEEDIKKTTEQILGTIGTNNQWLTDLYIIRTKQIDRQIFDKDAFVKRFGAEIYPAVTKPCTHHMVYLTSQEAT